MAKSPRRPRGTSINNIQVGYQIPPEAKKALEEVSRRMNVSASEGLELLIKNLDLDDDGLPAWADRNRISEALPMARAS